MRQPAIAVLVTATLLGGCAGAGTPAPESPAGEPVALDPRGSVFNHPWIWLDDRGERVTLASWRGTPLVVTAVYTTCFETCPRTIVRLRRVYDEFVRAGRRAEFVVVTLDPAVDTPERLSEFRRARGLPAAWHLLTGTRQATEQLMAVLDVHVMDMDVHLVHDSRITLFDAGGLRAGELGAP
jgi:protein SCO1/2